jgi:peptidoglycan hydrolase CwlO-like protein
MNYNYEEQQFELEDLRLEIENLQSEIIPIWECIVETQNHIKLLNKKIEKLKVI